MTDGTFTLNGLPIDLGNVAGTFGKVTAAGFEDKPITDINLQFPLKAGANPIGDLLIAAPSGSTPLPPFTIKGVVQVGGQAKSGLTVALIKTVAGVPTTIGSTTTDATGTYTFWVTADTYTVQDHERGGDAVHDGDTGKARSASNRPDNQLLTRPIRWPSHRVLPGWAGVTLFPG